jgi:hypothetical protein
VLPTAQAYVSFRPIPDIGEAMQSAVIDGNLKQALDRQFTTA